MLNALKRWIAGVPSDSEWGGLAVWAKLHGWDLKRVREVDGFVIDGTVDGAAAQLPWRMEWGPSQRDYIPGRELRIRMELQLPPDMQMLVLTRPLMDRLEKAAYEQFTQTSQTFIDGTAPEEMRWLSMFSKVAISDKSLRNRFAVVAADPPSAAYWVDGALSDQFALAAQQWLAPEPPFVLMTLRSRVYLRLACDEPQPALADAVVRLFVVAALQANRVAQSSWPSSTNEWPSTAISAWQAQIDASDTWSGGDTR